MHFSRLHKIVGYTLIFLYSYSLVAANVSAVLHSHGATLLNGLGSPRSSAIFTGDEVRTTQTSFANITAAGSSVVVLANSSVRFEGGAVNVSQGGVIVSTSKGMAARTRNLKIAPASKQPSKFEVLDSNGSVLIAAYKGSLVIADSKGTTVLREGQQTTRNFRDSKNADTRNSANPSGQVEQGGATPAATGAPGVAVPAGVSVTSIVAAGAVAAAIATVAVVAPKTSSSNCPISTSNPATPGCQQALYMVQRRCAFSPGHTGRS